MTMKLVQRLRSSDERKSVLEFISLCVAADLDSMRLCLRQPVLDTRM